MLESTPQPVTKPMLFDRFHEKCLVVAKFTCAVAGLMAIAGRRIRATSLELLPGL